jgi:hypothetical protein
MRCRIMKRAAGFSRAACVRDRLAYMGRLDIFNRTTAIAGSAALLLCAAPAQAQDKDKEPSAELEIGAAGEWASPGGVSSFGPSAAVEFAPIKDRLEIELGVSPMFSRGQTQYDTGLVFKTPLPLGLPENVEILFGGGPSWLHTVGGEVTNSLGATAQLDFEFWQLPERKIGWFVEPSYGYSFGREHEQSLGMTVGVLFAIP